MSFPLYIYQMLLSKTSGGCGLDGPALVAPGREGDWWKVDGGASRSLVVLGALPSTEQHVVKTLVGWVNIAWSDGKVSEESLVRDACQVDTMTGWARGAGWGEERESLAGPTTPVPPLTLSDSSLPLRMRDISSYGRKRQDYGRVGSVRQAQSFLTWDHSVDTSMYSLL